MGHWTLDDIDWSAFRADLVDPDSLAIAKTAAMVERNAAEYTAYLQNVFSGDAAFATMVDQWALEEQQHGDALGRWAELADPAFDYRAAFARFYDTYKIPTQVETSVRGSKIGELVARCVVETGTSTFYTALADRCKEPVFVRICRKIAADEFRHYRMFLKAIEPLQDEEKVPRWRRAATVIGRGPRGRGRRTGHRLPLRGGAGHRPRLRPPALPCRVHAPPHGGLPPTPRRPRGGDDGQGGGLLAADQAHLPGERSVLALCATASADASSPPPDPDGAGIGGSGAGDGPGPFRPPHPGGLFGGEERRKAHPSTNGPRPLLGISGFPHPARSSSGAAGGLRLAKDRASGAGGVSSRPTGTGRACLSVAIGPYLRP